MDETPEVRRYGPMVTFLLTLAVIAWAVAAKVALAGGAG